MDEQAQVIANQETTIRTMTCVHRLELARVRALVVMYRKALVDAGIEPPSDDGAEALSRFQAAFLATGYDDPFQHPELLAETWAA